MKRKVCIFTGSRAEYGLLKPLMDDIRADAALRMQVIVSGMHVSREFGLTYRLVEKDGFRIDEKIGISLISDTSLGICNSMGLAFMRYGAAYARLKPDIVVVLGDRFETFAAATAAMISKIPIAHIHGGEATYGVIDEAMRHSITKMSHLHFVSNIEYGKKVIQLGEEPGRVFVVGALGLDNIKNLKLLSRQELEKDLGFRFDKRNILVAFHPVTLENDTAKTQFSNLLKVLNSFKETRLVFTKANADVGGRVINKMIDGYVKKNPHKAVSFISMGQTRYLSTMRFVDAIVGNSSSGIIEAPSFRIGTVNIGDRQKGRIRPRSVIDCEPTTRSVENAFRRLYSRRFQDLLKTVVNPYGDGATSKRIVRILRSYDLDNILKKPFYDVYPTVKGGRV